MGVVQRISDSVTRRSFIGAGSYLPWLLFLISVCVRLIPFKHVFSSGKVYLFDPDCYIRLRKIFVYLQSFPATSVYDYFEGFPKGTDVISPPTMEYIVAALAYPFRSYTQLPAVVTFFVAIVPIVIGGFTVVLLYHLMCRIGSRSSAVIAGLVLALYPPFINATVLGRFDNEMMEPLLLLAIVWFYTGTYEDEGKPRQWYAAGMMSALYLCIWRGAVFPLAIIGIDMLVRIVSHRRDETRVRALGRSGANMYLAAAVPIAAICATDLWGTRTSFMFNRISWFHVALFGAAAGILYLTGEAAAGRKTSRTPFSLAAHAALAIVIASCIAVLVRNLALGAKVVAGGNAWIDSIFQYQAGFHEAHIFVWFGFLTFVAPLTLLVCRRYLKERLAWGLFLFLWTLIMAGAVLLRMRFSEYIGLNVALLTGIAVSSLSARIKHRGTVQKILATGGAAVVILLLQAPTFQYFESLYATGSSFSIKGDLEDSLVWLRQNTPSAGDSFRPFVKPQYGVLARWDYGGWIESIARRPVLATNFGTETYGMEDVARFMLAVNEDEMEAVLRRNEIRYIVVDKVIGDLPMYARILGRENTFIKEQWDPVRKTTVDLPSKDTYSLIVSRLFFADGSSRSVGELLFLPVEGLRLVYESASPASVWGLPWLVKKIKIFERVKGLFIVVRGRPGREATLSVPIETNQGRSFSYVNRKHIPSDGQVRFMVPYSRKKEAFATGAIGPVVITCAGKKREIAVTESDVLSGKTITFSW